MVRSIDLSQKAFADIRKNVSGMSRHVSTTSAARWQVDIYAAIMSLSQNAEKWPEADEAADMARNIRCKLYGRGRHVYRILFTIDDQTVNVLRIRHAAQDSLIEGDF